MYTTCRLKGEFRALVSGSKAQVRWRVESNPWPSGGEQRSPRTVWEHNRRHRLADGPLKVLIHLGLGTNSHIKPLLEVGAVLRARSHKVVYTSFEGNGKYNAPYRFPFVSLGTGAEAVMDQRALMKEGFSTRKRVDPAVDMPRYFCVVAPIVYNATYPAILQVMEQQAPDVVMCDFLATACRDAAQMLGIPLITGFQATDFFGITSSPFITQTLAYGSITTDGLSFTQRFQTKVVEPLQEKYRYYPMIKAKNAIRARYAVPPSHFPFGDFSTSLGLSSSFVGFEASLPLPPNIKMIGPIKSDSHPPLTPGLARFLDSHPRTLYVAFGSIVILADFDIANIVAGCLAALAEGSIDGVVWGLGKTLPEDFPEKISFNGTDFTREELLSNKLPHLQLLPWAPQTAILEHEHTRLFISHGGLESSFEAILSGTPVLCMPFLGDQPRNARKLEDAGIALYIDRATATPDSFSRAIAHLAEDADGSFAANAKRMRIIAQTGSRRKEAGADAVEEYAYTAQACRPLHPYKYGEIPCELKHLAPAGRNLSYLQANLVDVYVAAILLALSAAAAFIHYGQKLLVPFTSPHKDLAKKKQ